MVIERGEVWWADLPESRGSEPGLRRPLLIVQADSFNRSRIGTVLAITLTSNVRLSDAPGNVLLRAEEVGLPKDSVANVSKSSQLTATSWLNGSDVLPGRYWRRYHEGYAQY